MSNGHFVTGHGTHKTTIVECGAGDLAFVGHHLQHVLRRSRVASTNARRKAGFDVLAHVTAARAVQASMDARCCRSRAGPKEVVQETVSRGSTLDSLAEGSRRPSSGRIESTCDAVRPALQTPGCCGRHTAASLGSVPTYRESGRFLSSHLCIFLVLRSVDAVDAIQLLLASPISSFALVCKRRFPLPFLLVVDDRRHGGRRAEKIGMVGVDVRALDFDQGRHVV